MAAETLSTYLVRTRRLLHDLSQNYVPDPTSTVPAQFYSDSDLTADINDATRQRDMWSGGSRTYVSNFPLTIGQDFYNLATVFPAQTVLDVINVILIYGSTRVALENPTFTDLTTKARALVGYQNRPWGFCRYGATKVCIAPAPAAAYFADFDLAVLSTTFAVVGDADPLPFPYTEPIPFYAAYKAKINQRRYDEAEVFYGFFVRAMRDIEGSRVGQMLTAYSSARSGKQGY